MTHNSGTSFDITITAEVKLDLNGHTINATEQSVSGGSHGIFLVQSPEFVVMDTVGGGFIKGISPSSDANIDLFMVGNTQNGKLVLNSGSLILEVLAGNGNNAFSGVVDLYTNSNSKTAVFEMNGGSVVSKAKGNEAIRVADKHTGASKAELIINNGLVNGGIYVQGTSSHASEKSPSMVVPSLLKDQLEVLCIPSCKLSGMSLLLSH